MDSMDLEEKKCLPEDLVGNMKRCAECQTTRTPLWRGGPDGPRTLCNACGIKCRKKGIHVVNLGKGSRRQKEKPCGSSSTATIWTTTTRSTATTTTANRAASDTSAVSAASAGFRTTTVNIPSATTTNTRIASQIGGSGSGGRELSGSLKVRLKQAVLPKQKRWQRQRRGWGEVEQAAVCLLQMSYGFVF